MTTYNRPGRGVYLTNTTEALIPHGSPIVLDGYVGVAIRQKADTFLTGLTKGVTQIAKGEDFFLMTKGILEAPMPEPEEPPSLGEAVYFTEAGVLVIASASGANEVQTIKFSGVEVPEEAEEAGFFLTFNGKKTALIPWEPTAKAVEEALEALEGIGEGDVKVEKKETTYIVYFEGALKETNVKQLEVETSELGEKALVAVTTPTPGGDYTALGRVYELPGEGRGVAAGMFRIDVDQKGGMVV